MSDPSAYAPTSALRAAGLLREFNDAGMLSAADVHVAQRLGVLGGEADEAVLLAVALVVRSTRHGSVVVDLTTARDTTVADDEATIESAEVDLAWPDIRSRLDRDAICARPSGIRGPEVPVAAELARRATACLLRSRVGSHLPAGRSQLQLRGTCG